MLKILHTADWHIGKILHSKDRYSEMIKFGDWLIDTIEDHKIDVLLIAGDIYDNTTPSNRSRKLFFEILTKVYQSRCRHVVIIAGNHDSPNMIETAKDYVVHQDIWIVGKIEKDISREIIELKNSSGVTELIVCAVPFLRDRDIRNYSEGESSTELDQKLIAGIRKHYKDVADLAEQRRQEIGRDIPIIGMGHLTTSGGKPGDGVRKLYVGGAVNVESDMFSQAFDYVALGHFHIPQQVGSRETVRYSGSPIPIGFEEIDEPKSVCVVTFSTSEAPRLKIDPIPIREFQKLKKITGDFTAIKSKLRELVRQDESIWVSVTYNGAHHEVGLTNKVNSLVENSKVEVLHVKPEDTHNPDDGNSRVIEEKNLENLDQEEVFNDLLNDKKVSESKRVGLKRIYEEVIQLIEQKDYLDY